jgi:hypothetical protein
MRAAPANPDARRRDEREASPRGTGGPGPGRRHRTGARLIGLLVLGSPVALTGCGTIGGAQQVIDRAGLVNDLAARLDRASELTYTAEYQLPGGAAATIAQAQRPLRTGYTFPGGKFMVTGDAIADCRASAETMTCTLTPPPSPGTDPDAGLLTAVRRGGVVPPTFVVGLLTAASLDTNAVISQHDTTIAGEHATCVDVSGVENAAVPSFGACITGGGVLGSFQGTISDTRVDLSMTRLQDSVAEDAFDLPAGATIVDNRPRTR